MSRRTRHYSAWIALLAFALNALWPLLVQGRPAQMSMLAGEICTLGGMQPAGIVAGDSNPAPGAPSQLLPHCAFCSLGADRAPIPSGAPAALERTEWIAGIAPIAVDLPHARSERLPFAHPRAPPAYS